MGVKRLGRKNSPALCDSGGVGNYHLPSSVFWETEQRQNQSSILRKELDKAPSTPDAWSSLSRGDDTEIPPAKQATEVPSAHDLNCVLYCVCGNGAGSKNFSSQIHLTFIL